MELTTWQGRALSRFVVGTGRMTIERLAKALAVSAETAQGLCDVLAREGLLEVVPAPRRDYYYLTPQGYLVACTEALPEPVREYGESRELTAQIAARYNMTAAQLCSMACKFGVRRVPGAPRRTRWNLSPEAWDIVGSAYESAESVESIAQRADVPVAAVRWMAGQLRLNRPWSPAPAATRE